jgi:hypothetical protein
MALESGAVAGSQKSVTQFTLWNPTINAANGSGIQYSYALTEPPRKSGAPSRAGSTNN